MAGSPISPSPWGIPVVRNSAERDGVFPTPAVNQRVHNLQSATIQRFTGTSWVDDFFAGSLSTGTPAVLVKGVTVVGQPASIDFEGRVSGTPAGTQAQITVPDLPVSNAGGVVVASPTGLKFVGTGVAITEAAGVAVATITAGGGVTVQDDGTPVVAPANTISFVNAMVSDLGSGVAEVEIPTVDITVVNDGNSGTAKTLDFSTRPSHAVTLTGDCTFTFTAPPAGDVILLKMTQDGTGGRTVTWPATVNWGAELEPEWVTTADLVNIAVFWYDGTTYWGRAVSIGATP